MQIKTNYILITGKDENDLKNLLEDLKEYIVELSSNSKVDIKHNFTDFKTYISIKKGYTKVLNNYWQQDKIYVECVSSKSNIIDDISEEYTKKSYAKCGIIIDTNYEERKQLYNTNLKGAIKDG